MSPRLSSLVLQPHLPVTARFLAFDHEVATSIQAQPNKALELDELWSFVTFRKRKRWVWLALCRRTRQIVAYAIGDRSRKTCQLLWERIPKAYKAGLVFTDMWQAYQKDVPGKQYVITDKGDGQTSHIELFNNILRQRLARQTLSLSKIDAMHDNCLRLFLHNYNLRIKNKT